jgi:EAL domain-containing protein (putative c-di-GMP-specific phosphodiesterase class I)
MKPHLLQRLLDDPEALSVRFQPIFRLSSGSNQLDAMEGLVRGPAGTNFERADVLFDYIRRKHAESAVDRRCIAAICKAVADLPPNSRINLNVHASTLGENPDFIDFFRRQTRTFSLPLERFTLEIVEHAPTYNVPGLTCNLRALRDLGVRIALDDVGLGTSNYRMILDCHPDYFKVDAFFGEGISRDPNRRAVMRSVICLAKEMKGEVVAEGAHSSADLSVLGQLGVELFQAHLLCPPLLPQELCARGLVEVQANALPLVRRANDDFERARHRLLDAPVPHPACH